MTGSGVGVAGSGVGRGWVRCGCGWIWCGCGWIWCGAWLGRVRGVAGSGAAVCMFGAVSLSLVWVSAGDVPSVGGGERWLHLLK